MSKLIIQGGAPIGGTHVVPGNKNAALPMLAATLLAAEPVTLENVPNIADVRVMVEGLRELGARVEADLAGSHTVTVDPSRLKAMPELSAATCARIRTSILFAGPLLARKGRLRLRAAPGATALGGGGWIRTLPASMRWGPRGGRARAGPSPSRRLGV